MAKIPYYPTIIGQISLFLTNNGGIIGIFCH